MHSYSDNFIASCVVHVGKDHATDEKEYRKCRLRNSFATLLLTNTDNHLPRPQTSQSNSFVSVRHDSQRWTTTDSILCCRNFPYEKMLQFFFAKRRIKKT